MYNEPLGFLSTESEFKHKVQAGSKLSFYSAAAKLILDTVYVRYYLYSSLCLIIQISDSLLSVVTQSEQKCTLQTRCSILLIHLVSEV